MQLKNRILKMLTVKKMESN